MPQRLLAALVGFLALVGVGAAIAHYFLPPYNPGFLRHPVVTAAHVALGGLFLALAPFQLVSRLRRRRLVLHRRVGRGLVAVGLVVGVTGLVMTLLFPIAGWSQRFVVGAFGVAFVVSLVKGFGYARTGAVALHREWMIRALALGLAIASQRLIIAPATAIIGNPTPTQIVRLAMVSWIAFVLHAAAAELWIRRTRGRIGRRAGLSQRGASPLAPVVVAGGTAGDP